MRLKAFLVEPFTEKKEGNLRSILVPLGSNFMKVIVLHDGIYAYYEISELQTPEDQKEEFALVGNNYSIPDGYYFIDVVSTIVDAKNDKGEDVKGIMVLPVYKRRKDHPEFVGKQSGILLHDNLGELADIREVKR